MVNNVLAQAIVSPRTPDIMGSFEAGRAKTKKKRVNALAGRALQGEAGALSELQSLDPEIGLAIGESIRATAAKDINDFIRDAKIGQNLLATNPNSFVNFMGKRIDAIQARGGDTSESQDVLNKVLSGDVQGAMGDLQAFTGAIDEAKGLTAAQQEREALLADLKSSNPDRVQTARIALGQEGRASNRLSAEQQAEIERQKAEAKAVGGGVGEREQGFINTGLAAADSVATIKRTKSLLDNIKTGGFQAAQLKAKQLFGIESADEAELTNSLAKAVLTQLKATFGSQFTEREGAWLERVEAGLGKSAAGNKRILDQILKKADREARRGIAAARKSGDTFAVEEIQNALNYEYDDSEAPATVEAPPAPTKPQFLGFE